MAVKYYKHKWDGDDWFRYNTETTKFDIWNSKHREWFYLFMYPSGSEIQDWYVEHSVEDVFLELL